MKQPDNPPAFPIPDERDANGCGIVQGSSGMSLRDYFAAQVMSHMISLSIDGDGGWNCENVARGCYNLADAMLKARESRHD